MGTTLTERTVLPCVGGGSERAAAQDDQRDGLNEGGAVMVHSALSFAVVP